ncbi:TPA: hypothetical protein QH957_004219 [Enterobacter bugandensis]|nr:hypothetical protein [Enterobacter bugandensis]
MKKSLCIISVIFASCLSGCSSLADKKNESGTNAICSGLAANISIYQCSILPIGKEKITKDTNRSGNCMLWGYDKNNNNQWDSGDSFKIQDANLGWHNGISYSKVADFEEIKENSFNFCRDL